MTAKPRRAVLRKAPDAGVHPAEPRAAAPGAVASAKPARSRTGSSGTASGGAALRADRSEHGRD